jgi:hypothetical protein
MSELAGNHTLLYMVPDKVRHPSMHLIPRLEAGTTLNDKELPILDVKIVASGPGALLARVKLATDVSTSGIA